MGDTVVLREDNLVTCQWSIACVIDINVGTDGLVCVVTVKTKDGTYKRPVTKVALLLPWER